MEPIVTELSICSGKLNTSVDFTTHHSVPEKVKFYTFYYYYYYYYCYYYYYLRKKRELQQIAFNLWDIGFDHFRKINERCTNEPYLVNDTTLPSHYLLCFWKNFVLKTCFTQISKVIMTTDERIKIEKLQFDINRDATKTSVLY